MTTEIRDDPRARAAMQHMVKWHLIDRDAALNGLPTLMAALDAADPLRARLTQGALDAAMNIWNDSPRGMTAASDLRRAIKAALEVQARAILPNAPPPIYTDSGADQVLKRLQGIEDRLADIERGAAS